MSISMLNAILLGQAKPASVFGTVGYTTGTPSGQVLSAFGPYQDGYGSSALSRAQLLELGCASASDVSIQGGVDTWTSQEIISHKCGVDLPRYDPEWTGVLDECGGSPAQANAYHESMKCLYTTPVNSTHSQKVGTAADDKQTPIYGKWEDFADLMLPALDACNAHFGVTPDSNGIEVYHHHVAGLPPFVVGCYGPNSPTADHPEGTMVSWEECRELYPECNEAVVNLETGADEVTPYVPFCPCFDEDISNAPSNATDDGSAEGSFETEHSLEVVLTASGQVEDYNASSIENSFATLANVPADQVTADIEAASVQITVTIKASSPQAVANVETTLAPSLADASIASTSLAITVLSAPVLTKVEKQVSTAWPGCSPADLSGDFDGSGLATLGDAHHLAVMRLDYGSTGVNPIACLEGDFDQDGSFTVNDAAIVAQAQFDTAYLPWQTSTRRQLDKKERSKGAAVPGFVTLSNMDSKARTAQVRFERADGARGMWKAIGAQFTAGAAPAQITSVVMLQGAPGQIYAMHKEAFFQAADLSGAGLSWPMGIVATVTFAPETDMDALQVDYKSMNTYLVQNVDPHCVPKPGSPCKTTTVASNHLDPTELNLKMASSAGLKPELRQRI